MNSLLLLLTAASAAQVAPPEPTLASNRPGFSFAAGLAPEGRWVIELGVRGRFADAQSAELPIAAARLGLTSGVELSIGLPSYTRGPAGASGLGNLTFGVKLGAAPRDWLAYSFVAHLVLPVGDAAVADQSWQGVGAFNVELYFAGNAWTSLNTQLDTFTKASGGRGAAVTPSVALGYTFVGSVNPFVQTYLRLAEGEVSPFVGGGVAWLVIPRIQLDVGADYDVDGSAVVVDAGISMLW